MPGQIKDTGINFHPRAGTLLMCDFRGMVEPEINKRRPVVVVTPRLKYRDRLAMIVPTSTTEPQHLQPFQVRLSKNYHPNEADDLPFGQNAILSVASASRGWIVFALKVVDTRLRSSRRRIWPRSERVFWLRSGLWIDGITPATYIRLAPVYRA